VLFGHATSFGQLPAASVTGTAISPSPTATSSKRCLRVLLRRVLGPRWDDSCLLLIPQIPSVVKH
jgi:hypothetical protein